LYCIGLDVQEDDQPTRESGSGPIHAQGTVSATCFDLDRCMKTLPQPWTAAMETTFYPVHPRPFAITLQPHAATPEGSVPADAVGHCGSKKKVDRREEDLRTPLSKTILWPSCYRVALTTSTETTGVRGSLYLRRCNFLNP
jgi:hypothetical protein